MGMRIRVAGVALLLVGLSCGLPAGAQTGGDGGQDGQQGPAVALGAGGRMVRGTVSAVVGDKITLKTDAGEVFTVAVTPNTRVMKGREPAKMADVRVGDGIGAMGEMDQPTKTVHALFVSVVDAEQVKKIKESMGKTWIAGRVTAIDELKLTILRSDKVSQVIAVDEDTSFKRGGRGMQTMMQGEGGTVAMPQSTTGGAANGGGESITLADVKVGDNVAGKGSLKNGVFVPTELAVADPAQRRRRQQGEGAAGPGPNATMPEPK